MGLFPCVGLRRAFGKGEEWGAGHDKGTVLMFSVMERGCEGTVGRIFIRRRGCCLLLDQGPWEERMSVLI